VNGSSSLTPALKARWALVVGNRKLGYNSGALNQNRNLFVLKQLNWYHSGEDTEHP
jgi:hypothetical protein